MSWGQSYQQCCDMVSDSIRVERTTYWRNDGIDLMDCQNVKLNFSFDVLPHPARTL